MKLSKAAKKLHAPIAVAGYLKGGIDYEIAQATCTLEWTGPKIHPALWAQILSFFRWTNDTMHSESQVRLFANAGKGVWGACAFPQEARTGMSARELAEHPNRDKAREQFKDEEGWSYLGTVHHHCNSGAFQSGTDRDNEETQEGLHITVGHMDKERHEIHCRFYFQGTEFNPDMALFWEVGAEARASLPADLLDRVARWQMCQSVDKQQGFPALWRDNVVEVKTSFFREGVAGSAGMGMEDWRTPAWNGGYGGNSQCEPSTISDMRRKEEGLEAVLDEAIRRGIGLEQVAAMFDLMENFELFKILRASSVRWAIGAFSILDEWLWAQNNNQQVRRISNKWVKAAKKGQLKGLPPPMPNATPVPATSATTTQEPRDDYSAEIS